MELLNLDVADSMRYISLWHEVRLKRRHNSILTTDSQIASGAAYQVRRRIARTCQTHHSIHKSPPSVMTPLATPLSVLQPQALAPTYSIQPEESRKQYGSESQGC